jgi:2-methylcitrate dehydratase PrpD
LECIPKTVIAWKKTPIRRGKETHMPEKDAAVRIGDFAARCAREPLAANVAEKAATCLLDALGLGITAKHELTFLALRDILGESPATSTTARLWSDASPARLGDAVLANAWLAHAEFHDDGEHGSWTHPGSLIVPVAVSMAESLGGSVGRVAQAIACGYGTLIWLGAKQKVAWAMIERGFRTSAVLGRIGAAATASVMLGLDRQHAMNAIAIATGTTGGTLETVRVGSDEFRLQNAHAAHGGLLAAQLAERGVVGSAQAFNGPKGFLHAFAGMAQAPTEWMEDPSTEGVFGAVVKPWAVLGHSRGPIGAAKLIYDLKRDPATIKHVAVRMCQKYAKYPSTLYRGPYDRTVQALGSMNFLTAAMLLLGELEYDVSLNQRANPRILDLAERVSIHPEESFSELDAIVSVQYTDGSCVERSSAQVPRNVYFHDRPRSTEVFEERTRRAGLAAGQGQDWADRLFSAIEREPSVPMRTQLDHLYPLLAEHANTPIKCISNSRIKE